MKRFGRGLVIKAHRLLYHSTLRSRAIKKERRETPAGVRPSGGGRLGLRDSGMLRCGDLGILGDLVVQGF